MSEDEMATLRVVANPFCAETDHKGRAHGRIYEETQQATQGIPPRFVGARLYAKTLKAPTVVQFGNGKSKEMPDGVYDFVTVYDPEPVTVLDTPYYRRALTEHGHHGAALLAADVETHRRIHGSDRGFRHPLARIAQHAEERKATPVFAGAPVKEGEHAPNHKDDKVREHFEKFVADAVSADNDAEDKRKAAEEEQYAKLHPKKQAPETKTQTQGDA